MSLTEMDQQLKIAVDTYQESNTHISVPVVFGENLTGNF